MMISGIQKIPGIKQIVCHDVFVLIISIVINFILLTFDHV